MSNFIKIDPKYYNFERGYLRYEIPSNQSIIQRGNPNRTRTCFRTGPASKNFLKIEVEHMLRSILIDGRGNKGKTNGSFFGHFLTHAKLSVSISKKKLDAY